MLSFIRNIFTDGNKKRVLSNILSLSVLQATNYIVPFIAIPYLIRVLGDEKFGLVMFAQVFIQYFMIIVDFGLEYTGTREISIHRNDTKKLHEIFNSLMIIKCVLLLLSILILSLTILLFENFRAESLLYFLTFGMVFGQILFPVWLFQGLEKMKFIVLFNFISKSIFTILIFVFIHKQEDYANYAIINSTGYIITGIVSFIVSIKIISHKFFIPNLSVLKDYFYKTRNVFVSNLGISLYITSTPFILGLVTHRNDLVGYYSVAEKVVRGIRYSVTPITQALFPYLSKRFHVEELKNSRLVLQKLALYLSPVLILLMAMVFFYSDIISRVLTGHINTHVILDIKIMSAILIIGTFNNIFGVLGMVNLKMEKSFRNYVLICGTVNVIISLILSNYLLDIGAAISIVVTELFLLLLLTRKLFFSKENV